jgi:polygalacturonase
MDQNRREFIINFTIGVTGPRPCAENLHLVKAMPWKTEYPKILARIIPPVFPKKDFNILKYGAKPGGTFDCREAINTAIDACAKAGGGELSSPPVTF